MAEQYVFSVAFDSPESDVPIEDASVLPEWQSTLQALDRALQEAHLGSLESDRWEEYGHGRIFWGTRAECASVRSLLQQFEVDIEGERNIETGYYNTEDALYYVTEPGDILCIDGSCTPAIDCISAENTSTATVQSMPLDAYPVSTADLDAVARLRTIGTLAFTLANQVDPNLPPSDWAKEETVAALASILTAPTHTEARDEEELVIEATTSAIAEPTEATYFDAIASETIHSNTVSSLETRIGMLEADLSTRPDPERVADLERQLEAARTEAHTAVESVSREKAELVEQIGTQSRALDEWNARFADLESQAAAELASTRHDLQAQIADRDREIVQLKTQRDEFQATQTSEADMLRQQLDEKERAIANLDAQLTEARTQLETAISHEAHQALQHQLDEQTQARASLEAQLNETRSQLETAIVPETHQAVQRQLGDREEEIAALQGQVAEARSLAEAKIDPAAHQALQQQLDEKMQAAAAIDTQLDTSRAQLQQVEQHAREQAEAIAGLEADLAARPTAASHQSLQDQLDAQTEAIAQLERQLAANRAEAASQTEAIDALEQQLAVVRAEAETQKVEAETLEALQTELQQAKEDAAARIDPVEHRTLKRKSAALVGQMKQLQAQLVQAQEPKGLWASLKKRLQS
ncbi:MAG: hypothetical protein AAFX40_10075 [Cyanobacteria bacterium J06639_1]